MGVGNDVSKDGVDGSSPSMGCLGVQYQQEQDRNMVDSPVSQSYPQLVVSGTVRQIAMDLSHDIVYHVTRLRKVKPSSKHSATLRRTVLEMSEKHEILFNGIMKKLQITSESAYIHFYNVANEIFKDGQTNWGRIVTVYAFGARIAKHLTEQHREEQISLKKRIEKVADFVGKYVADKLGPWITQQGGWDSFDEHFAEQPNIENFVWKGLVVTALGLGALATMVGVR